MYIIREYPSKHGYGLAHNIATGKADLYQLPVLVLFALAVMSGSKVVAYVPAT